MEVEKSNQNSGKSSENAYAYTPGLKIKLGTKVVKERILPLEGDILVEIGDTVPYDKIVAKTTVPGDPVFVKGSMTLGVEPEELLRYVVVKENSFVNKSEVLAKYEALFGLIKKEVLSPIDGIVESISGLTGQIIIRGAPKPVEIDAYIPGSVVDVQVREGVSIETGACFIQGIFGIGGENHGTLKILVDTPEETLEANAISEDHAGAIIVGGSDVSLDALKKALELGVAGVVVGGIDQSSVVEFLGREIGVAITGTEDLSLTLIITEGFGRMAMSHSSFDLLKRFEGHLACINGATQIRAGVMRPEIIIPHVEDCENISEEGFAAGMVRGTSVRIIAEPYFGAIGKVTSLPVDLQRIGTESRVRVLNVELKDGRIVQVPRANVEIIDE